ncbi:hypothetical protein YDYSY3_02820 [Paenibacillus chitinolyticus]|nr:hypothetical protein YDYSY3_02820 [Paenibacillus chitinolyticus]
MAEICTKGNGFVTGDAILGGRTLKPGRADILEKGSSIWPYLDAIAVKVYPIRDVLTTSN